MDTRKAKIELELSPAVAHVLAHVVWSLADDYRPTRHAFRPLLAQFGVDQQQAHDELNPVANALKQAAYRVT